MNHEGLEELVIEQQQHISDLIINQTALIDRVTTITEIQGGMIKQIESILSTETCC
jgi:hypothetical protein